MESERGEFAREAVGRTGLPRTSIGCCLPLTYHVVGSGVGLGSAPGKSLNVYLNVYLMTVPLGVLEGRARFFRSFG